MNIKKLIGQIHLWVGLVIGILFFFISVTGAIYTWAPEIGDVIYHKKIEPKNDPIVSASKLKDVLKLEFPDGDFRTVLYKDNEHAVEVLVYGLGTYFHVQMNPYTGALVHIQDMNKGWLNYTRKMHRSLLLGDIGRQIVHWTTLLFLIMLISGIVLWWPVNNKAVRQRLTIKRGVSSKKLNYDLHNVLGFYASWILIFVVLTGIFWSFKVIKSSLKYATGEEEINYDIPLSDTLNIHTHFDQFILIDSIASVFRKGNPTKYTRVNNPHQKDEPIHVVVHSSNMTALGSDHYYFDRYTGNRIVGDFERGLQSEISTFNKIQLVVYDTHFGTIMALPGRLLVFFASLIASSLPITGFIVWIGKRKKQRKSNGTS